MSGDWQSGANGIAKVPKLNVFRSGIRTRPRTVMSPVQANALTHSVTALPAGELESNGHNNSTIGIVFGNDRKRGA